MSIANIVAEDARLIAAADVAKRVTLHISSTYPVSLSFTDVGIAGGQQLNPCCLGSIGFMSAKRPGICKRSRRLWTATDTRR